MRTLVVILASSAEVYSAVPALRALRRSEASGELHVLVRDKAIWPEALVSGFKLHSLDAAEILEPIFENGNEGEAHERLTAALAGIEGLGFQRIYNLSFSALSSYVVDFIANEDTEIFGYTRYRDGTLRIPDDVSAYVHAQAGTSFHNRYHFTQLFAAQCGVELQPDDLCARRTPEWTGASGVIVNLGSSQVPYPAELWAEFLRILRREYGGPLVISCGPRREALARTLSEQIGQAGFFLVESLDAELIERLRNASVVVSAEAGILGAASLCGVPTILLCDHSVNFWERGPWSTGSRVLQRHDIQSISPQAIADQVLALIAGKKPEESAFIKVDGPEGFQGQETSEGAFAWNLVQALYTSASYPQLSDSAGLLAFQRLFELSELAVQTLSRWESDKVAAALTLKAVDEMLAKLPDLCAAVGPVVRWFETERLRMGPASEAELLQAQRKLFSDLFLIASVYREYGVEAETQRRTRELCLACAPSFREFDLPPVADDFQKLLAHFHELARHSTKVGDRDWSAVLTQLTESLDRRDYIEVADQLEHVLPALLAP